MKKSPELFDKAPMMKELHEIHHQIYEETKNMTSKEIANKINQEAEESLREMGYSLAPMGMGKYKLVEIKGSLGLDMTQNGAMDGKGK